MVVLSRRTAAAGLSLILLVAHGVIATSRAGEPPTDADRQFDREIAPLLAARCLGCHAGASPKGGLDLSRRDPALAGGESGVPLVAGDPESSLLWQRVRDGEMPPDKPLDDREKEQLHRWIASGAHWNPRSAIVHRASTGRRAGYDWWSLQSLAHVDPPMIKSAWARNEIDRFILQRLEQEQLAPSPPAPPRILVRRLYFDLIGLPPSPEAVEEYVRNPSDAAYDQLVSELLNSPQYGERWGRHWLDVVRYGESDGFERNQPRKNLWHYRDWVIEALNRDMPYDEFVRMQLAGDTLDRGTAGAAAVGFLVAGVHNTVVGSSERMKRLARQDELEEIAGTVGQTFLGLTVNCARCHDHKFDPISSREYYQLIAALDGVNHGEREFVVDEVVAQRTRLDDELSVLQRELAAIDNAARETIEQEGKNGSPNSDSNSLPDLPQPYAMWEFEGNLRDSAGSLHGRLEGTARLEGGALVLDGGSAYVQTSQLDRDLLEKTLEAWVFVDGLDQRGGGIFSLENDGGGVFDAIVYGEREPRRWMAGSNGFARTQPFDGADEQQADMSAVHIALVYQRDGSITAYRNGSRYGHPYRTDVAAFKAGESHLLFGMRHAPPGGNKMFRGRILRAALYDRALDASQVAASAKREEAIITEEDIVAALDEPRKARRLELTARYREALERRREFASREKMKVYTVAAGEPGIMRVHPRGSVAEPGEEVAPGGVAAVSGVTPDFGLAPSAADAPRRQRLAEWITSPANPLLPRVMANRVWHYHFGVGIVDTPNDLGFNGGRPSHPELLEWLATYFQAHGYRLKALHRLIVTSATYRQSSAVRPEAHAKDAGNRLLWRFTPRRMDAEVLRDSILEVAGVLNRAAAGPGFEDVEITYNNGTTYYEPVDPVGAEFQRRTVYRFTPRGGRTALLDTFDCPDPSTTAPRRSVTTTPLQALSLLNNSFVLRMSERFAERVSREGGPEASGQVRRAWQLALGRLPASREEQLATRLLERHGLPALCRALFNVNEFVVIE